MLDMVRSMMNLTILPLSFLDYALESATCILNMVSTKKVDKTPYELWYGKFPNLSYLMVCGYEALVKRDTPDKLQQRSVKYAEFFEKNINSQEVSGWAIELEEIQDEDTLPSETLAKFLWRLKVSNHLKRNLGDLNEPTNYKVAMLYLESDKWLDAMNAKMQSIKDNQVWCLVNLPPNAKGFTQTYEVDYEDTFSPVTNNRAIRILIAIAAFYDHEIWKMDVKTAFLNGYLDEDIYMVQPEERLDLNKTQGASTTGEVKRMQNVSYASSVGSIMYAVRCTRPDVAFAQNITSRFQQNPSEPHWTAVKTILTYLRNINDMLLIYDGKPKAELRVDIYSDARFETDKDDIKSQTGYVFVLMEV
ncbi:retrotransposon protein, putative, ty1-copia subclass [Tanacetum coccineum]